MKPVQLVGAIVGIGEQDEVVELDNKRADQLVENGLAYEVVALDAAEADKLIEAGEAVEVTPPGGAEHGSQQAQGDDGATDGEDAATDQGEAENGAEGPSNALLAGAPSDPLPQPLPQDDKPPAKRAPRKATAKR